MFSKLLEIYKREQFMPTLIGMFINPFYLIRSGLYQGISEYSKYLKGSLLDFGCGSKPYKDLFEVNLYVGVDVKDKGHSHSKEPVDVYYNGEVLPFKNEMFDSVFSSEVFEHIPDLSFSLKEIHRVTKVNGSVLFTVPFVWDEHEVPFDFFRYSRYGIKKILEENGFQVIKISTTTKFLETIFQLWILFLHHKLFTKYKYLNIVITIIMISPFTIGGKILTKLLPKLDGLYHDSVIFAKRI